MTAESRLADPDNPTDGTFGLSDSSATPTTVTLQPVSGNAAGGTPIASLSSGVVPLAPPTVPASFTMTVRQAALPAVLQTIANGQARLDASQIDDIVLLINYTIG